MRFPPSGGPAAPGPLAGGVASDPIDGFVSAGQAHDAALVAHLQQLSSGAGGGAFDLGVLSLTRDTTHRNLSVQLGAAMLNARNDSIRAMIESLGKS